MGQKVHPIGFRLGVTKEHTSRWYANSSSYADLLNQDIEVRDYLKKKLAQASVSRIQIDRPANNAHITIHTARPGVVIGKKGEDIDALRADVARKMGCPVQISIEEIRKPELDATLVADGIAQRARRPGLAIVVGRGAPPRRSGVAAKGGTGRHGGSSIHGPAAAPPAATVIMFGFVLNSAASFSV